MSDWDAYKNLDLESKCKEFLRDRGYEIKKSDGIRQYRSNQGRSPKQMESNYMALGVSVIGLLLCFLYIFITS